MGFSLPKYFLAVLRPILPGYSGSAKAVLALPCTSGKLNTWKKLESARTIWSSLKDLFAEGQQGIA